MGKHTPSGLPSACRKHLRRKVLRQELKLASAQITADASDENVTKGTAPGVRASKRLRQQGEWGFRLRRAGRFIVNAVGRYMIGGLSSVGFEYSELEQLRCHARQLETALRKQQIAAARANANADMDDGNKGKRVDSEVQIDGNRGRGEMDVADCPPTVPTKTRSGSCPRQPQDASASSCKGNDEDEDEDHEITFKTRVTGPQSFHQCIQLRKRGRARMYRFASLQEAVSVGTAAAAAAAAPAPAPAPKPAPAPAPEKAAVPVAAAANVAATSTTVNGPRGGVSGARGVGGGHGTRRPRHPCAAAIAAAAGPTAAPLAPSAQSPAGKGRRKRAAGASSSSGEAARARKGGGGRGILAADLLGAKRRLRKRAARTPAEARAPAAGSFFERALQHKFQHAYPVAANANNGSCASPAESCASSTTPDQWL